MAGAYTVSSVNAAIKINDGVSMVTGENAVRDTIGAEKYDMIRETSAVLSNLMFIDGILHPEYQKGNNQQGVVGSSKTIDDIIDNLPETTNGKGVARNFESTGGFDQTIKDFDSLNPSDVKEIQTQYGAGKVGKLSDGTTVVARPGSTTGGATLEIKVSNSKVYKIRY